MTDNRKSLTLTDQNFQHHVLESEAPILVDFWADWCGPCHMIAPVIEDVAETFAGQITIGKLNVDEHPEIARQYGIRSLPTLLFFKDGHIQDQLMGAVSKAMVSAKVQALLRNQ